MSTTDLTEGEHALRQDILEVLYDHAELCDQARDYNGKCTCGWKQDGFQFFYASEWREHVADELIKFLKERYAPADDQQW